MLVLRPKGIFCLEGDWSPDLKRLSSVEPILSVIDQRLTPRHPHIHRDVGTLQELTYYLKKWTQKQYAAYPILYLGFHGQAGKLFIGDARTGESELTLDKLGTLLAGRCKRRVIHLGACSTLDLHGSRINSFLKKTGALAVSGFSGDIDWVPSAAFDLLVLAEFQVGTFTLAGIRSAESRIKKAAGGLAKKLEFRMAIRSTKW